MADTRGVVRLGMPSNEKPKMGKLQKFLTEYCKLWKSIGYKLGLEDAVLDMIEADCPSQRERFAAVLQKWLKQDAKPTWSTLELAITNARREELSLEPLQQMPVQLSNGHKQDDDKSQEGKFALQATEQVSTSKLSVHFNTFLMTIRKMLEEKCVDKLESCKEICCSLTVGDSDVLLFSDEQLDKINQCSSFQQLFAILRRHWNWKEYSILESIITICESKEAEAELHKYEKLMGSYYGMKLISESYSPSELAEFPENYVKLCITVDKPYKSLTLQDYYELQSFIFEHLEVKKYIALPFIKFLFSSLHLEWYIPMQAVSHIIKAVHQNGKAIIEKRIVLIKIGDKNILDIQRKSVHTGTQVDMPSEVPPPLPISKNHSHIMCPSCNQVYKNPKYLPCYHSYCEECLEKMEQGAKITCLKCRNEAVVPAGGVKDLPNNYFMGNLINKLILSYKLEDEVELRCEDCDEDDPVVFCKECKLFLCHFCEESHKYSKSHSGHILISLTELMSNEDLSQSQMPLTCQEHDLELEHYCETCERLVCVLCTAEHEGHRYDIVKKLANKYQNELNKITASVEVMIDDLAKLKNSIENVRTVIRQQGDEVSEEIDLYYDKVVETLLKQKEEVKQQVRETMLQKEKALTEQLVEVTHTKEEIMDIKRVCDSLQTDQEVLSAKDQLIYSLMSLIENFCFEPIECANIEVTPVNEPLPLVVKHFTTIDSLSFDVKLFSNSVQRGQMAMLELITKDHKWNYYPRGGCEVTVQFQSSMEEMITAEVLDYKDGTYTISFAAQQVGEIELSVFVNGHGIEQSPFIIVVQDNLIKPSKVITDHDNNFGKLSGIACSNSGMWAVADWNKRCVHLFDSQDRLIKRLGIRETQFNFPCGVAFDDHNDLYVTDNLCHRVQKFDAGGNCLLEFGRKGVGNGQLNYPAGITTHQDKVYVADCGNHRISVFKNDGEIYGVIGQQQLSNDFNVAVNINGELLVADWGHHCIDVFTLDGQCIKSMTLHKERGNLQLKDPCSITTDSNGFILLADAYSHCITVFDKIGNCVYCFGSKGSNNGQFKFPHGIAVGPKNNIYVSDTGNRRIQIYPAFS